MLQPSWQQQQRQKLTQHTPQSQHRRLTAPPFRGLVAVGRWADTTVRAAQAAGLANVAAFDDAAVAGRALAAKLDAGDVVLVKGSRAAGMERVIEALSEAMKT